MLPVGLTFSEEAINSSQNMQNVNKVNFQINFSAALSMDPYVDGFFGSSLSSSLG